MPPAVKKTSVSEDPQVYENLHVHEVYEKIAVHFSATRYKPWPIIAQFLSGLPEGWIGLDSGTGNGKYLPLPENNSVLVGLDRSFNLLKIARHAGSNNAVREVVRGDVLDSPWRPGIFDYAISIATIHHLATTQRRKLAVQRLLQAVSDSHGRILIYVWAIEQDELSKREIPVEDSTVSEKTTMGQDVFVPWNLNRQSTRSDNETQIFNRYYHMFAKGELIALVVEAARELGLHIGPRGRDQEIKQGVDIVQDGWERSNYYIELRRWKA
ncbi:S-adenosyl-L-methionine-dependent methyltransferase [Dendrothele bispora CBS 962.96]|uniref:S-adenosyl-L-methionine-dependent methyltransferase n=1 Tax=Dendrothele bispora (strain CBS 962.96) TaxID=1314807 RepID=A0A4S8LC30_DENBC|nr:S-adenosyl-L-methionine-dependent methyltransferase [Dendrothele bispora CBS 962.96]THU92198.1 S-adenosyl-L-methionine-dependent methyltransferase [Dendrothele bispora CBS 962.96]